MANNTFGDQAREEAGLFGGQVPNARSGGEGFEGNTSSCYIDGDEVRVVVVRVSEGRIADWKGGVKDWLVTDEDDDVEGVHEGGPVGGSRGRPNGDVLVNGIV